MSTKSLMADRRVAEVTLNDKGKAATLTLAPGWTYEGSSGPFTLDNVEHGHKICKAAVADASVAARPRARKSATPAKPSQPGEPFDKVQAAKPLPETPLKPRGDELFVYRLQIMPKGDDREQVTSGKEVMGWFKITQPLKPEELEERTWAMLKPHMKGISPETHECRSFRWTNKHQSEARCKQELGSPWHGENHGD